VKRKRVRKLVKSKKKRAKGVTKIFGQPGEPQPDLTPEELLEIKRHYYYNLGQHVLFPEFEIGCPECGMEEFHREFCTHHPNNR